MFAWCVGLCFPPCFLSASEMSQLWLVWSSQSSRTAVPAELTRGLIEPLFQGNFPRGRCWPLICAIPKHSQTLLHSASFINWIICFELVAEQVKLSHAWLTKPEIILTGSKWFWRGWVQAHRPVWFPEPAVIISFMLRLSRSQGKSWLTTSGSKCVHNLLDGSLFFILF